jgi:hypothetical protein
MSVNSNNSAGNLEQSNENLAAQSGLQENQSKNIHVERFGSPEGPKEKEYKLSDYVLGSNPDSEGGESLLQDYENSSFLVKEEGFLDDFIELQKRQKQAVGESESAENAKLLAEEASLKNILGEKRFNELQKQFTQANTENRDISRGEATEILEKQFEERGKLFEKNIQADLHNTYEPLKQSMDHLRIAGEGRLDIGRLDNQVDTLSKKAESIKLLLKEVSSKNGIEKNIGLQSQDFKDHFTVNRREKKAKLKMKQKEKEFEDQLGRPRFEWTAEEKKECQKETESIYKKYTDASQVEPMFDESEKQLEKDIRFDAWFATSKNIYTQKLQELNQEMIAFKGQADLLQKELNTKEKVFEGEPIFENIAAESLKNIHDAKMDQYEIFQGNVAPSSEIKKIQEAFKGAVNQEQKDKALEGLQYSKLFYDTILNCHDKQYIGGTFKEKLLESIKSFQKTDDVEIKKGLLFDLQKEEVLDVLSSHFSSLASPDQVSKLRKGVEKAFDKDGDLARLNPLEFAAQKDDIIENLRKYSKKIAESGLDEEAINQAQQEVEEEKEKEITEEDLQNKFDDAIERAEYLSSQSEIKGEQKECMQNIVEQLQTQKKAFETKLDKSKKLGEAIRNTNPVNEKDIENNEQLQKQEIKSAYDELMPTIVGLDKTDEALAKSDEGDSEIRWVSIMGAVQGAQDFIAYMTGRIEQNLKYEGKLFGKALGEIAPGPWAKEFAMQQDAELQSLEEEERNKWNGMEKYGDSELLENNILKPQTKHHWRKAMEVGAERGLIRWEDPLLQNTIYKLTKKESASLMPWTLNQREDKFSRDTKLRKMCYALTNNEGWFDQMKNKNQSGATSEREKYMSQYNELQQTKQWGKTLGGMLQGQAIEAEAKERPLNEYGQLQKNDGKNALEPTYVQDQGFNQHNYVNIILKSIKDGQMSNVEQKLFFLIRGVATGLLTEDVFQEVGALAQVFPPLAAIVGWSFEDAIKADRKITGADCQSKNFKNLKDKDEEAWEKNFFQGNPELINKWFHNDMKKEVMYQDRMGKTGDQEIKGIDVDDQYAYMPDITIDTAKAITKERSTATLMKGAAWKGGLSGFTARMNFADTENIGLKEVKSLATSMSVHLQIDSVLSKRFFIKGNPTIDTEYDTKHGQGGKFTVAEHSNVMKNFMAQFLLGIKEYDESFIKEVFYDKMSTNIQEKEHRTRKLQIEGVVDKFPQIVQEHAEEFKYFLNSWQESKVIAHRGVDKNGNTEMAIVDGGIKKLNEKLKFDPNAFQQWKQKHGSNKAAVSHIASSSEDKNISDIPKFEYPLAA